MMTATPARQMAAPMMQAGDEAIDAQRDDARADPGDALVFTDALLDEPAPPISKKAAIGDPGDEARSKVGADV